MITKQVLPNATAVFVLGICSLVFGCFFVGLIIGIVGIVMGNNSRKLYLENPNLYEGYSLLTAGWIMSIIGTVMSTLYVIYWFVMVLILGGVSFSIFQLMENRM